MRVVYVRFSLLLIGVLIVLGVYATTTYFSNALYSRNAISDQLPASSVTYAVYFGYIIGVALVILGLIVPGQRRELKIRVVTNKDEGSEDKDDAVSILKKRYARGELTKEEYARMKEELEEETKPGA